MFSEVTASWNIRDSEIPEIWYCRVWAQCPFWGRRVTGLWNWGKVAELEMCKLIWVFAVVIEYFFTQHHLNWSDPCKSWCKSRAVGKREYLIIIFLISHWNHMLWPLIWTILTRRFWWGGHNICFYAELTKLSLIITKYSLLCRALKTCSIVKAIYMQSMPF